MNDYIVGVDIGTSKICAAIGKLDKQGKLQIIGITSEKCNGLKKGVVVDIDSTSDSIKNCITQLERMTDLEIGQVYISIPDSICELVENRGVVAISSEESEIKVNDIARVLNSAKNISLSTDKQVIDVIPEGYIVDGYKNIKDPIGMNGIRLEVQAQVVVAPTTVINSIYKSVSNAGYKINGLSLQAMAISDVVIKKEEKEMGVALIDVGSETTDIAIFKNDTLKFIDKLPLGGNNISNDLAICLKLPLPEAEKIKIKYAKLDMLEREYHEKIKVNTTAYNEIVELEYGAINEIIFARVEEILKFAYDKLVASGYYDEVSSIVIVGGGLSFIRGIVEISRNVFEKPIRIGSPEYVGAASPIYSTAVGVVNDATATLKKSIPATKKSISKNVSSEEAETQWDEEDDEFDNEKSFITKIKKFLSEFF